MAVYPDYYLSEKGQHVGLFTDVRKQRYDGIWFLIPVIHRYEYNKGIGTIKRNEGFRNCLKMFHDECYRVLKFYKLYNDEEILKQVDMFGHTLVKRDNDQRSEEERLIINGYLV